MTMGKSVSHKEGRMKIGGTISGAIFSADRRFRYALWRIWDKVPKSMSRLLFIGLNPSTANATKDDPTIVRLVNFAKSWGFGGLFVGNLFSLVSTDPEVLLTDTAEELYRGPNDMAIKRMWESCSFVVVGWGEFGKRAGSRPAAVMDLIGESVYCIKMNQSGEPSHPLYLPSNSEPIRYYRKGGSA